MNIEKLAAIKWHIKQAVPPSQSFG